MPDVLFFLLLGHFVGDYAFQSDRMAQNKGLSLAVLSQHVLIYTVTVGVFWWIGKLLNQEKHFLSWATAGVLTGIYLLHWLQDFLKSRLINGGKQSYYVDQAIHVTLLYLVRILF
jgi:hypothetical protein